MFDRELPYVKEYQQRLIDATNIERQFKHSRPARSTWSDYVLLRLGDSFISLGQRLKKEKTFSQQVDLTQECA